MNFLAHSALVLALVPAVPTVTSAQQPLHAAPAAPKPAAPSAPAPTLHSAPVIRAQSPANVHPPQVHSAPVYPAVVHPALLPATPAVHAAPALPSPSRIINNPHRWGGWGWNRGVPWYPASNYWGYGFWGPWGLSASNVGQYGSIAQGRAIYPSRYASISSPGAQLLMDYELHQTQCGPPNLVIIWGPNNSVICAHPNNLVLPGNYRLDPATLTIKSL
jgi:hypothetical protein